MNNATARGYVLSGLTQDAREQVKAKEKRLKYCMVPGQIYDEFNPDGPHGDTPEDITRKTESRIIAISNKVRQQCHEEGLTIFDEVAIQHAIDDEIVRQCVPFPRMGTASSLRDKIRGRSGQDRVYEPSIF